MIHRSINQHGILITGQILNNHIIVSLILTTCWMLHREKLWTFSSFMISITGDSITVFHFRIFFSESILLYPYVGRLYMQMYKKLEISLSLTKFAPRMFENVQLGVQRLISSSSTKNVTNTFKESMLCIKISGGIGGVERLGFYFLNLITWYFIINSSFTHPTPTFT